MRKNKKIIMAMAIVLAVATAVAGATFAWFSADDGVVNHMETGQLTNGDVQIVEIFPVQDINPGVELDKVVWTVNGGNVDALVRMSFAEVLQMLDFDGDAKPSETVWDGPGTGNAKIPQLFSSNLIAPGGAYSAWLDVEAAGSPFTLTDALPDGAKVLYKSFIVDENGPNEKTTYSFLIYGEIAGNATSVEAYEKYNGALQFATAEFELNDDMELTVSDIEFMYFQYANLIQEKWAELARFDDLAASEGFTKNTPDPITLPMFASIADPGSFFELTFGAKVFDDVTDCTDGDSWWYNAADGYFYYIGKLAPGQATSNLLESVALNSAAGNAYCNLLYDLIVKMEAIQNIEQALGATDGWNITGAWLADLIAQLDLVDAFAFS